MIDRASILAWNEQAPWTEPAMVEQDLIICKALVCIFSDDYLAENLAFRGGTALHKLYLQPQVRYSEDIDLVQIYPGPIKPIMLRLGEVLSWMPDKVTIGINELSNETRTVKRTTFNKLNVGDTIILKVSSRGGIYIKNLFPTREEIERYKVPQHYINGKLVKIVNE